MKRHGPLYPLIVVGFSLALMVGVCAFFYLPVNGTYHALRVRAAEREGIQSLHDIVAKAEALKDLRRAKEQKLALWRDILGRSPEAKDLLGSISTLLGRCGLVIAQFTPLPTNAAKAHGKIVQRHYQQISFEAPFEELVAFLRLWRELPWLARIERLQLEPITGSGTGRLNVSMYYSVYARVAQSTAGSAPPEEER
jgi:hypothetical protein